MILDTLRWRYVAAVSTLVAAACGDSTGPASGRLAGRWAGPESRGYPAVTFTLRQEDDSVLTGEGTVRTDPPERVLVIGRVRPTGSANLTISTANTLPALFIGTAAPDGRSMTGTIRIVGGGFVSDTVTLRKQ